MKDDLSAQDFERAIGLLRQAVGDAARVVAKPRSTGHQAELLREDAPPLRLRLRRWDADADADPGTVWVLRSAPRDLLRTLRARNASFVAINGAVRLVGSGFFLDRTDLPRARVAASPRPQADPFADRNSLVPRALLESPGRRWGVREIAEAAGVSLGTASQVVRALASMGVVEYRRRGRKAELWIENPALLIRRWAGAYSWERNHAAAFAPPMGDPVRFLRRARRAFGERRWALTLQAGASLVAPHAAWERVHAYVDVGSLRELYDIADEEGWPEAQDGGLVLMKPHYRHSVWHGLRTVDDLPVVSDVQLVLDLWHYPLRGMEQAEHLLATASRRSR